MTYSKYTDPKVYPRFGGDELDPPPYVMNLRSAGLAASHVQPKRGRRFMLLLSIAALTIIAVLALALMPVHAAGVIGAA
jgi:hypothetical protein